MGERGAVLPVSGGPIEAVGPRRVRRAAVRGREGDFERPLVYATYDHLATGRTANGVRPGEDERAWTLFHDVERSEPIGSVKTIEPARRDVSRTVPAPGGTSTAACQPASVPAGRDARPARRRSRTGSFVARVMAVQAMARPPSRTALSAPGVVP